MPSANKDRIRVTLHVDRKIYALVKMWSEVDQKPISRLFDDVFWPHVERFEKYKSFFDYQAERFEKQAEINIPDEVLEEMDRKQKESQEEHKLLSKMSKEEKEKYYQKFRYFLMQEEERKKKEEEEYNMRWVKARSRIHKNKS
jgi:hypothetical protein